jgi:RsmE family RNA methyltransferase
VQFASSLKEAIGLLPPDAKRIVLDNVWDGIPLSMLQLEENQPAVLAIGGERGFSDRERTLFREHAFQFASLGKRILRTETACSAGVAILLGRMGLL